MFWTIALENGGYISYLLLANRRYSTAFEVQNAAGAIDNISDINFSEIQYMYMYITLLGDNIVLTK